MKVLILKYFLFSSTSLVTLLHYGGKNMKPVPHHDHPINELIKKRWSPRSFSSHSLAHEEINQLIESARWAASAFNEQPWRFIYAEKEETEKFEKLVSCLAEGNRAWASKAPLLMVTCVKTFFDHNGKPNRWATHDLGLAMGNMTHQAMSMDIYVHHMAGFSSSRITETFTLPEGFEPVTMVALGRLGDPGELEGDLREREEAVQERKKISELILEG